MIEEGPFYIMTVPELEVEKMAIAQRWVYLLGQPYL